MGMQFSEVIFDILKSYGQESDCIMYLEMKSVEVLIVSNARISCFFVFLLGIISCLTMLDQCQLLVGISTPQVGRRRHSIAKLLVIFLHMSFRNLVALRMLLQ